MAATDALARQARLQAELRERHDRRCARDDCERPRARNSASELCPRCWKFANGYTERDLAAFRDAPGPPVTMSRAPDQPTNPAARRWWVTSGCVLCGGPTVRVDQRGVERGPATITRQLIGLVPGVPFVVGARCQQCEDAVRANRDKVQPLVAAVTEMLQRADFDIFALHVIAARLGGLDDPPAPSERWGHTFIGPAPDDTEPAAEVLSNAELTRELALLRTSILRGSA